VMEVLEVANILSCDIFSEVAEEGYVLVSKDAAPELSAEVGEVVGLLLEGLFDEIEDGAKSDKSVSFFSFNLGFCHNE